MPVASASRKTVLIVVVLLTASVLVVVLLAAGWYIWARQPYSRESFQHRFLGASADDVRGALGGPERMDGPGCWYYRGVTADPRTGQRDDEVAVQFIDNRVFNIAYPPRAEDADRERRLREKDKDKDKL
jgi:hypothetical protein